MAKEAVTVSTIPPIVPNAYTAKDLALRLHFLWTTAHGRQLFPPLHGTPQQNNIAPYFGNSLSLADKFVSVVRALATSCTPGPGKDNVTLVVGIKAAEIHIFVSQDGGESSDATVSHIKAIWKLLQKIHAIAQVPPADPSLSSAPRVMTSDEPPDTKKLDELVYSFVRSKALTRATKRFDVVTAIAKKFKPQDSTEEQLIQLLVLLVRAARGALPHRDDPDFAKNRQWLDFRICVSLLSDCTKKPNYGMTLTRVQKQINDILKSSQLQFDVEKFVAKITKVHAAIWTLYGLAVSPRRREFVERELVVHFIPLPEKSTIDIDVRSIPNSWSEDRELAIQNMRSGNICVGHSDVRLRTTVHSECHIVAWLAQNLIPDFADLTVIPYVTCSKLHCFGCFTWLSAFKKLHHPGLPTIYYDGSRGKLYPGWTPPSLGATYDQKIRNTLIWETEEQFRKPSHSNEGSASSTTSDFQTNKLLKSTVEENFARFRELLRLEPGLPALDPAGDSPLTGGGGSTLDAVGREKRKLHKALRAISALKEKRDRGDVGGWQAGSARTFRVPRAPLYASARHRSLDSSARRRPLQYYVQVVSQY
ncbi:hypothetical protein GGX14DRAFT_666122 [Mycena pura]|uniref:Uncharacterized protein n=1 Tax=Mycena pura TaxID=153505 RepID=A0AAD6UZQ3_9AGAR|nr:hypothetical protein GGX14DRAFT_666122 [Mycena pura]